MTACKMWQFLNKFDLNFFYFWDRKQRSLFWMSLSNIMCYSELNEDGWDDKDMNADAAHIY